MAVECRLTRLHRFREWDRDLVKRRKKRALDEEGRPRCEVCGFDYEERYGERGRGFIQCHHTRPVHTLDGKETTRLADLALVCANCHQMIHSARPCLTVEQLRVLVGGR